MSGFLSKATFIFILNLQSGSVAEMHDSCCMVVVGCFFFMHCSAKQAYNDYLAIKASKLFVV